MFEGISFPLRCVKDITDKVLHLSNSFYKYAWQKTIKCMQHFVLHSNYSNEKDYSSA